MFQYFLCLVITVITVYPFLFIVMTSLKPKRSILGAHGESRPLSAWTISGWSLQAIFYGISLNSIIVCVSAVFLVVVCSTMVSFAISKLRFKGAGLLFAVIMVGMMIPVPYNPIPIYDNL